jgi:hypothetical protein
LKVLRCQAALGIAGHALGFALLGLSRIALPDGLCLPEFARRIAAAESCLVDG